MTTQPAGRARAESVSATRESLRRRIRKLGWIYRLRPQSLAAPLYRLLQPDGSRAIIEFKGCRLFIDPFTTHGMDIVMTDDYEPDLINLIQNNLPRGGTFLDIGANEGIISAIASRIVGPEGMVVAVEPQQRLQDILEINLALNTGNFRIVDTAITEQDGDKVTLNLGPPSHSGGSSLVRTYRWGWKRQHAIGCSIDSLLQNLGIRHVDVMKIDVEGYEPEVIRSARASLGAHQIGTLAIDYHGSVLSARGVNPADVDAEILAHGYARQTGDGLSGYAVYIA